MAQQSLPGAGGRGDSHQQAAGELRPAKAQAAGLRMTSPASSGSPEPVMLSEPASERSIQPSQMKPLRRSWGWPPSADRYPGQPGADYGVAPLRRSRSWARRELSASATGPTAPSSL